MTRTITNPADGSPLDPSVMRNELQILENEIASGGGGVPINTTVTQASHGFSAGQWVGLNNGTYALTNAIPGAVYQKVGIVSSVVDANTFVLQTSGDFADTNLIPGMTYYLSASAVSAPGTIVGYPPPTAGYISAPVAIAKTQTLATIEIGRPSIVATAIASFGMNVTHITSGGTDNSDADILDKNLANKQVRINIPSWNDATGITNARNLALLYKGRGYTVTYGITGLSGVQNATNYALWLAQVPTEAAWASANSVDTFYIGNEEDWQAQIGQFGTITGDQVRNDVRSLSTTLVNSYPSMQIVYSTAQGTLAQWAAFNGDYGALQALGFNMYDTQANFDPNIAYFQSQIGPKFFASEWGANHPYYDMIHTYGYTDALYAADLASRVQSLTNRGVKAYFFALRFGNNTLATGNWNILLNTGVFNPGAASAFGGAGNAVKNTPIVLTDNQKMFFNTVDTSYLTSDSTNFSIVAPAFGNLLISGRTRITSTQTPQFKVAYDTSNYMTVTLSSAGAATISATGTIPTVSIANFNTVLDATTFSGADIGVKINAAYAFAVAASIKGVIITIPSGVLSYSHTILFGNNGIRASLRGTPGGGTELDFTGGANSPAIVINTGQQNGTAEHSSYEAIRDITFKGNATTSTNPIVGVLMGNKSVTFTWDHTVNSGTGTISSAVPIMFTGNAVTVSNSGGGLPSGLAGATTYYMIRVSATTFQLATSLANANAGTAIVTTTDGTGTQTVGTLAYGAAGAELHNVNIEGFGKGYYSAGNTYHTNWFGGVIRNCAQLIYIDIPNNSGEALHFYGGFFVDPFDATYATTNGVQITDSGTASCLFSGCSFDDTQVRIGQANNVTFIGNHFENPGSANWGAYVYVSIDSNVGTNVSFNGDTFFATGTVSPTNYIDNGGNVTMNGVIVRKFTGSTMTNFMTLKGSGRVTWHGLNNVSTTAITNVVSTVAYTPSGFANQAGNFYSLSSTAAVGMSGKIATYNGVATAGLGVPAVYAAGRSTAQVAANASVSTYTLPAADGTFVVSANVLVTTSTTHSFTVTCTYTDEGNTSRTLTMPFTLVAGSAIVNTVADGNGTVPYMGIPQQIRCKASTAITIATTGTFTTVTYNVEGLITQIA